MVGRTDWRALSCTRAHYSSRLQPTHSMTQPIASGSAPLAPLRLEMGGMGAARESNIIEKAIARLRKRMRRVL